MLFRSGFELGTSRIQLTSVTAWTKLVDAYGLMISRKIIAVCSENQAKHSQYVGHSEWNLTNVIHCISRRYRVLRSRVTANFY
jgi:hypothetical protein